MTDEFIMKNCTKCKECYQIGKHMYGCGHKPYKGKWIAEIENCPKNVISMDNRRKYKISTI